MKLLTWIPIKYIKVITCFFVQWFCPKQSSIIETLLAWINISNLLNFSRSLDVTGSFDFITAYDKALCPKNKGVFIQSMIALCFPVKMIASIHYGGKSGKLAVCSMWWNKYLSAFTNLEETLISEHNILRLARSSHFAHIASTWVASCTLDLKSWDFIKVNSLLSWECLSESSTQHNIMINIQLPYRNTCVLNWFLGLGLALLPSPHSWNRNSL